MASPFTFIVIVIDGGIVLWGFNVRTNIRETMGINVMFPNDLQDLQRCSSRWKGI